MRSDGEKEEKKEAEKKKEEEEKKERGVRMGSECEKTRGGE